IPSSAASRKTRSHVAVSSSSSLASSASGFEQYGQPSGHRWVSSARSPRGLFSIVEPENATQTTAGSSGWSSSLRLHHPHHHRRWDPRGSIAFPVTVRNCSVQVAQLCRSSFRGHSEIMFGVLVIVLGRYPIARQELCLGQG